jgi:acyl-CoA synthetase (AMP-forming)/AMP-acid ligase II
MAGTSTLGELLARRATAQPTDRAYGFLAGDGTLESELTFEALHRRAAQWARRLREYAEPGDRALLMFPPGLEFIVAFFACMSSGIFAVPMMPPRRRGGDSSKAIVADCVPRLILTNRDLAGGPRADVLERFRDGDIRIVTVDLADAPEGPATCSLAHDQTTALLQYTSGSTSLPKGVVVTHANLLSNLEMIRIAYANTKASTYVSWVPLYHDMGLILNALQSLYVGAACILLAPATFMHHPLLWLRAISDYRAEVAGAPNFAFDHCVDRFRIDQMRGVNLSGWRVAFNGAEPVRAATLRRFAKTFAPFGFDARAANPGYGMAEATLLISGGRRGGGPVIRSVSSLALQRHRVSAPADAEDAQEVVGCGRSLRGEEIAIVDPDTLRRLPATSVGEIWVRGANVARAYWRKPEESRATFQAHIEGEPEAAWLRTGDLGFLDGSGELFVTGRIKDIILVRGMNHYPQDIEDTVQSCHPALRRHFGAAFAVPGRNGQEQVIVVQEIERVHRRAEDLDDIIGDIREAVAEVHELTAADVVLIRTGTLPMTTSGKVQRALTRRQWLEDALEVVARDRN